MIMNDTNSTEGLPGVVRATKQGRWFAAALTAAAIALILPFIYFVIPALNAGFNPMPSARQLLIIKGILVALAGFGVLAGAIMIQTGRKILRSGQCPPPDAWLWYDTKIKRGAAAIQLAWAYIITAVICCLLCIGMVGYILVVLDRLPPSLTLPPGVKIIEQIKSPA